MRKLLLMSVPLLLAGCVIESTEPYYVYNEPSQPRVVVKENRIHPRGPIPPRVVVKKRPVVVTENRVHPRPFVPPHIAPSQPRVVVKENRIHTRGPIPPHIVAKQPRVVVSENRVHQRVGNRATQVARQEKQQATRVASRKQHVTVGNHRVHQRTDTPSNYTHVPQESRIRVS